MDKPKVKVTQEVLDLIELSNNGMIYWEDDLLAQHAQSWATGFDQISKEAKCLSKYTPLEMARIIDGHYELELTPNELVKQKYVKSKEAQTTYDNAFANGIVYVLTTLNIKIEGVND